MEPLERWDGSGFPDDFKLFELIVLLIVIFFLEIWLFILLKLNDIFYFNTFYIINSKKKYYNKLGLYRNDLKILIKIGKTEIRTIPKTSFSKLVFTTSNCPKK